MSFLVSSRQGRSGQQHAVPFWVVLAMGIVFALIWSSAFSVAKIVVTHAPPFSVAALRFVLSAALAGSVALALGQRLPRGAGEWWSIIILGLCQNTIYLGLFFTAMTHIAAAPAAIIASSLPLFVAMLAPVLVKERVSAFKAGGLLTGFSGILWIMAIRVSGDIDPFGIVLAMFAVLSLATATLTIKRTEFGTGLLMVVACQLLVGGLGCVPIALVFEDVTAFEITRQAALAFAYQVVMPGIVATLLWFMLVKLITASGASTFHFLNPVFGVAIAHVMLGETISLWDGGGVALVATGIFAVSVGSRSAWDDRRSSCRKLNNEDAGFGA